MRETRQKTIAAVVFTALVLSICAVLFGVWSVRALGQSDSSAVGKGLGGAKPIVIEGRPEKGVLMNPGWKLFLVGTNSYDNLAKKYDLHYAVKDVESLKKQFILLGVPEENIVLLTSEERGASLSNRKNILKAFNSFIAGLGRNDSAFVYLSGHGFRLEKEKRAYYAPKDIDLDDIRGTGVSIEDMIDQLKDSSAKFKWMTVDACRDDPLKSADAKGKSIGAGVSSACIVNPMNLPDAFVFMQGCANGQRSLEAPALEQGLLTYSLLEALQCDDNQAVRNDSGELNFNDLIYYVQTRTQALARMCRDEKDKPCAQEPRVTCAQLPSFTLLTNLRHGGLTEFQRQEIDDFENYLMNNDIGRAEDSLLTIVGFFPDGTNSEQYQELKQKLEDAKRRKKADGYYRQAQDAYKSKEYASAKTYIDKALEFDDSSIYRDFRDDVLTVAVEAAVNQAITDGNVQKAQSLNGLLAELDAKTAEKNKARIAGIVKPTQDNLVTPTSPVAPQSDAPRRQLPQTPVAGPDGIEAGDLKTLTIAGVKVNFRWASAGTFLMGSPEDEEGRMSDNREKLHEVTLTKGFWIAETETTQNLWQAVMGTNPSSFSQKQLPAGQELPVDSISWYDCDYFVMKLNSTYSDKLPVGYKYAMPTEAQWEYACRAGTITPFNFGSKLNGDQANCDGSRPYGTSLEGYYKKTTTTVGSYPANAWGLYDMHGNVWEWCADWYDEDYYTSLSAGKDPTGPESGTRRVLRGGSWFTRAKSCRSASRLSYESDARSSSYGFRLVLVRIQ